VLKISRHLDRITSKLGVAKSNYQPPDEVVDNLFKKHKDRQAKAIAASHQAITSCGVSTSSSSSSSSPSSKHRSGTLFGAYIPEEVLKRDAEAALFDDVDTDEVDEIPVAAAYSESPSSASAGTSDLSPVGVADLEGSLSEEEFHARAAVDPEFTECFGLFHFMYQSVRRVHSSYVCFFSFISLSLSLFFLSSLFVCSLSSFFLSSFLLSFFFFFSLCSSSFSCVDLLFFFSVVNVMVL
jgi:hypothetical protein